MKNTFKIIASFFVGGAIGGGVSYFLLKKKFDARIDAEVQSIKDLYSSKLEENKEIKTCENLNDIENSKNENNKKSEEKIAENKSKTLKSSIEKQEKQPPVDYANYYAGSKGSDAEAKKDNNVVQEVVVSEKKNTKKVTVLLSRLTNLKTMIRTKLYFLHIMRTAFLRMRWISLLRLRTQSVKRL